MITGINLPPLETLRSPLLNDDPREVYRKIISGCLEFMGKHNISLETFIQHFAVNSHTTSKIIKEPGNRLRLEGTLFYTFDRREKPLSLKEVDIYAEQFRRLQAEVGC